jgi:hypothetical protein
VVENRIVLVRIHVRIEGNSNGRTYTLEAHAFACGSHTCADRLENKYNAIGAAITATQENIEPEIEWIIEVDFIGIPNASALRHYRFGKCVTVAAILLGRSIEYVL